MFAILTLSFLSDSMTAFRSWEVKEYPSNDFNWRRLALVWYACSFAVAFISIKIVLIHTKVYLYITFIISTDKLFRRIWQIYRKIPLTELCRYILVAGQIAGSISPKRSLSQVFSNKFFEVFLKRLSQSASMFTTSDFRQRFRRIVSNIFLGLPQTAIF